MKFYKFLDDVKDGRYHQFGKIKNFSEEEKIKMVESHPFIFSSEGSTITVPPNDGDIDLPFKSCFFEILGGPISSVTEQNKKIDMWGIYVEELSPKKYDFFILVQQDEDVRTSLCKISYIDTENGKMLWNHILGIVGHLISRIGTEEVGFAKIGTKIKLKTKKGNRFSKISKVIYVCPYKERSQIESAASREVDWSHQWTVRGHWRSIPGRIGKNRDGLLIKDHTWISNYIKGPEHAPLVNKVRLVKDHSLVQD